MKETRRRPPASATAAAPRSARSGSTGWAASPRSAGRTRSAAAGRRTWSPPCPGCTASSYDVRRRPGRSVLGVKIQGSLNGRLVSWDPVGIQADSPYRYWLSCRDLLDFFNLKMCVGKGRNISEAFVL